MIRLVLPVTLAAAVSLASPAAAQTTTTTTAASTTTTTTLPACASDDVTLTGFKCRLEAFRVMVQDADGLGRLRSGMLKRLQRGLGILDEADSLCTGHDEKAARKQVQQAARQLTTTLAKIRSNNGRKIIPGPVSEALQTVGNLLQKDMKSVRKSLTCA